MIDETAAIVASVIAGIAGGFLSSWMAFNASGEKFDPRKHGNALITGALGGMALGLGLVTSVPEGRELTSTQFAIGLFSIFLASVGIDRLRSSGAQVITKENITRLKAKREAEASQLAESASGKVTPPSSPPAVTEEKK